MAEYATKQDMQEIVDRAIDKAVTDLSEVIASFAQTNPKTISSNFNSMRE